MIAAFYDGDLSGAELDAVEEHIGNCPECREYLNSLKLVGSSLEILLDKDPVTVPGEFSKKVTAAAESNVAGLRSKQERSRAVAIVAILLCFAAIIIGTGFTGVRAASVEFATQAFALVTVAGHLVYKTAVAFSMFASSVCSKVLFSTTFGVLGVGLVFLFSFLVFSKHITRFIRS